MKHNDRSTRTFSLLQLLDAGLAVGCIGFGGCYIYEDLMAASAGDWLAMADAGLFGLLIVGCLVAQVAFFRLCGRLKHQPVFIAENDKALGVIAAACGVNTALLLVCTVLSEVRGVLSHGDQLSIVGPFEFLSIPIVANLEYLLLALLMGSVALIAWILQLMMRRAVALQQENDATV